MLKHMHDLSDGEGGPSPKAAKAALTCARWLENPYYQDFCDEKGFLHALPFDRSSLTLNSHGTPQYMTA